MLIIDINPDGTTHETVIPDPEPVVDDARASALAKLAALGLTEDEITALLGGTA